MILGLPTPVGDLNGVINQLTDWHRQVTRKQTRKGEARRIKLARNVADRQVRGRHGRAGSKLRSLIKHP